MRFSGNHSLSAEMNQVHNRMITKYNLIKTAHKDIERAQRMEQYLRAFKSLRSTHAKKQIKPNFQISLETEALEQIALEASQNLGLNSKKGASIFRWGHIAGRKAGITNVDDVFEAELSELLKVAAEKATGATKDTGVEVIGKITGNIAEESIKSLQKHMNSIVQSGNKPSELLEIPTARAIKTDVTGYSAQFLVSANIKPQWREFLYLFKGVKMTVKNYSSRTKYETIRLGKTAPQKAIIASLNDIGYRNDQGTHIYYHLTNSIPEESQHILHLRFTYELAGGGLYAADGHTRLDAADFFVYNDPASTNIWVRSTKAMIAEMMKYVDVPTGDPLHSEIMILKSSFT